MQYKLINNDQQKTYAVVLESGEEVMEQLMAFAKKETVRISQFTAIGAFSGAVVGFFDFSVKDYKKIPLREQTEVLTLNGDITLLNDDYKIHAHVILGKEDGRAYGGHLIKATVHPTLEIILNESPAWLRRQTDPVTGLALMKI